MTSQMPARRHEQSTAIQAAGQRDIGGSVSPTRRPVTWSGTTGWRARGSREASAGPLRSGQAEVHASEAITGPRQRGRPRRCRRRAGPGPGPGETCTGLRPATACSRRTPPMPEVTITPSRATRPVELGLIGLDATPFREQLSSPAALKGLGLSLLHTVVHVHCAVAVLDLERGIKWLASSASASDRPVQEAHSHLRPRLSVKRIAMATRVRCSAETQPRDRPSCGYRQSCPLSATRLTRSYLITNPQSSGDS
jgi:hypothetical protein